MSWSSALRMAAVAGLTLGLAGCFTPLYGPTASGERLDAALAAVEVDRIETPPAFERVGHYLRSELVFDLDGSGAPAAKRYKLAIAYAQQVASPIIDANIGRAQSATVQGEATYTLTTLDGRLVTSGKAFGNATYDRSQQRFATVRAARDADIRLAKVLSEQIRTRLAVALRTGA
ncbi:MAG TPA: LPS assembly lipoprotein LptE [Microvirga sp.]|jgi:LPS-assembly lipoprotein|nr:LPS assembly lipoprotein LptE [Microvirga sp.]